MSQRLVTVVLSPISTLATPTDSTFPTAIPADNSLSTGTKAGIGVGAAVGAILFVVLGAFLNSLIRQRRRYTVKASNAVEIGPGANGQAEVEELGDTGRRRKT